MSTWVYFILIVGGAYISLGIGGFPLVIAIMLACLVWLYRDAIYIIRNLSTGILRKATYLNVAHASFFFVVLTVNGLALTQGLIPPILPEWQDFTTMSPVWIAAGLYGITNIRRMYMPAPH
jgi:hypothetical protein